MDLSNWTNGEHGEGAILSHYEVFRDDKSIARIKHLPQTTKMPFLFKDSSRGKSYRVVSVDLASNRAESESLA